MRESGESSKMGKQMIRSCGVHSSTSQKVTWRSIDWKEARGEVRRLQMRIAKAVQEGKHGRVKSLQWILTHSFYAKALAVKRVTSNQGKNTPGVDGILWKTAKDKMQAVYRLRQHGYISAPIIILIRKLNEILRGWAYYHRHVVSSEAFRRVDTYVYEQLWRMVRKRHPNKSGKWLSKKYWTVAGKKGIFAVMVRYKNKLKMYRVIKVCSIGIRRHRKIKADANPYLREYGKYFWVRRHNKEAKLWRELSARQMRLALT